MAPEHESAAFATEASAVAKALDVSPADGLTDEVAAARLRQHGPNALHAPAPVSASRLLARQFASPIAALLAVAAGVSLWLGERAEFVAILAVIVANVAIGFGTELRARRSMEALRGLVVRQVAVRRDGRVTRIDATALVPGDIVIVEAGDVIAADLRVIEGANLAADESALTGESLPVAKRAERVEAAVPLAERASMLHKGTAITRGNGTALVIGTGMQTELGRIASLVDTAEPERSPLERQLADLGRTLIGVTLAITSVVGLVGALSGQPVALMFEAAVALAVAAIPEGLPIVATLALARGMLRMARRNALIERLGAVETLGATTVILTDKTGTLTENRMRLARVSLPAGDVVHDATTSRFGLSEDDAGDGAESGAALDALLGLTTLCNRATRGSGNGIEREAGNGDPMEIALLDAAAGRGIDRADLIRLLPQVDERAFDTRTRLMASMHRDGDTLLTAVKGAPEAVFAHVESVAGPAGSVRFDAASRAAWSARADALATLGLRVLAVASHRSDDKRGTNLPDTDPWSSLELHGLVAFDDPPRADVQPAIAAARRAGVSIVMLTGDHESTAARIAHDIGLSADGDASRSGRDFGPASTWSESEREALRAVKVLSRVTPEQKIDIVRLHQDAGEVVAMTGDGVNDAPALRQADIGIAMGQRGTQVAREAADMVLLDDAFRTIVDAIREGRTVYTNIRRFSVYLLSCNLSEILIVGLALLAGFPLPLLPLQILFLNLVTDVFPAFALGSIDSDGNSLERPPRPPAEPILGRRQWRVIIVHGLSLATATLGALAFARGHLGLTGDQLTSTCFLTLAIAQLWHLFGMRNWRERPLGSAVARNRYVWIAIVICLVLLVLAWQLPMLSTALRLVSLPPAAWGVALACAMTPLLLREMTAWTQRRRAGGQGASAGRGC